MPLSRSSSTKEVGLRLLFCPLGSNIILRTACSSVGVALPVYSRQLRGKIKMSNTSGSCIGQLTHSDELPYFLLGGKATVWNYLSPFLLRCQAKADQPRAITHAKVNQLRAITQAKVDQLRAITQAKVLVKFALSVSLNDTVIRSILLDSGPADQNVEGVVLNVDPNQPEGCNAVEDLDGITSDTDIESDLEVEETLIM
ncbi:hypothetical protein KPL70_021697 [Citrus sinensis]|nr:hypothetical protein KPL70_021697 [Citrus sinensis]